MNRISLTQIVALAAIFFCGLQSATAEDKEKPTASPTSEPTAAPPTATPAQISTISTTSPDATNAGSVGASTDPAAAAAATNATPGSPDVKAGSVSTTDAATTVQVAPPSLSGLTPQQVYFKYHDAISKAKSLAELMPFMAKSIKNQMDKSKPSDNSPESLKKGEALIMLVRAMEPQGIKLKKESITGDTATLELTADDDGAFGKALDQGMRKIGDQFAKSLNIPQNPKSPSAAPKNLKRKTTGVVTMHKQDGVWKVGEQKWDTQVGDPPKPPTPQQAWAFGAKSIDYPKTPARGKVKGVPFMVDRAELASNGILTLRQGSDFFADREFTIFLFGNKGSSYENTSFVTPSDSGPGVHMSYKVAGKSLPSTDMFFSKEIGMKLQFGKAGANQLIPGYIVLRMPDKEGSFVQGYFYATRK